MPDRTDKPAREPTEPEVVARRTLHAGAKFSFESVSVRRPSGKVVTREMVRHPGAVVIVPVLDDGRLVLIRNFRFTAGERLWECCAGTLEPPESPAACAARELAEETGYHAGRLEPLVGGGGGWFYTTPGMTDERMHAFFASGLVHVGQDLEEDETIEVVPVAAAEVLRMIDRGEIRDGKSIAAILLAQRRGLLAEPRVPLRGVATPGGG